jgi:hypothetical protein
MGRGKAVMWTVGGTQANVKLTYLKYSVCKTFCEEKDGQCDCSKTQCGVKKVVYDCECVSAPNCPAKEKCPTDTMAHTVFPRMYV